METRSEFLSICGTEEPKTINNNHNERYNDWEESCLKNLVEKYKPEYREKFLKWLDQKKEESQVQEIVVVRDSGNFSSGQTASIGAGAAAGGAGLALTIPLLGKWLMRFF